MEGRLTVCNMSIEAGARAGMIAPDDTTIEYIAAGNRPFAPKGKDLDAAIAEWRTLRTDDPSAFDRHVVIDADRIAPQVTWGTNPGMTVDITGTVPDPDHVPFASPEDARRALDYMGLTPGRRSRRFRSTSSSSARARMGGSRTSGWPRGSSAAGRSPRASGR